MFSWNFAKSAEAVFSRLAIKKVCKFLLKKKLGQLILGDIDLNQLDVQLSNGTIQLSDLALNVDFINQKFGESAILTVKEGSIGSLTVRLPWKGRNCEIEVEELEIVLAPGRQTSSQVENEPSTSNQDSNNTYTSHSFMKPEHEMADSTMTNPPVDIHEGVKTIAKMVKWLLTSFHVKIKKLIIALDPVSEGHTDNRTLVLRFGEVECGTGISDEVNNIDHESVDSFLGLSRLTNFVKFDGAVLEFLHLDDTGPNGPNEFNGISGPNGSSTTPVITGEKGGFSGTIKLSIPWKNGSLDIRKLDADVFIDPIELRLQPSTIKSFMNVFQELESFMENNNKTVESVYYNASFHGYSSEFSSDNNNKQTESYLDALLRGSHLISDWMTSPVTTLNDQETEEPDFDASVDQFFECFDELRTSQSALGNSGMWNWTCSVFSAISAASNLASGSLQIPSEQKHVETSLKARMAQIVILFSFVDEDQKSNPSCVHYINADFQEMQLLLQVCPQESNFEAKVNHIDVSDHFKNDANVNTQSSSIRKKQAAVQHACPPLTFIVKTDASNVPPRNYRGIYSDDVAKVLLFKTSGPTQFQYITPSDTKSNPKSFSIKLPPLVFWINFHLISSILDFTKEIENSFTKKDLPSSQRGPQTQPLRGNISIMDARILLCFPCEKTKDYKTYTSWKNFIVIDLSSPLTSVKVKQSQRFRVTPTRSFHLTTGNISVYFLEQNYTSDKFTVERVFSVFDKKGNLSVLSIIWQDNAVTGPWVTKKAKKLSTSDGTTTTTRNKSTVAFVTTIKDLEDSNTRTHEEMVTTSSFIIHATLPPVNISLTTSLYQKIHHLSHEITDWLSHISPNHVPTSSATSSATSSQLSIFLESNLVEVSLSIEGTKEKDSWCKFNLKVGNFELLTVSNTGGVCGADFFSVGHNEGRLVGSTSEASRDFVLITCESSSKGRGNGEGSNILCSRFPGCDIIHMWDPQSLVSQVSVNIRCATIVAIGGRLDWFDSITSFFSQNEDQDQDQDKDKDKDKGSCFILNLIDTALSYEPYPTSEQDSEQKQVSGLLAASSLKLSNVSPPETIQKEYEIKGHDLGLLISQDSESNFKIQNLETCYSEQSLRKLGYVKIAEETHIEAVIRTNCENGHEFEVECNESHIVLETCQDSTSGLAQLAAQIQQIFAPDVEESIVHLQTRWDRFQLAQSRMSSHHSTSSSSEFSDTCDTFNLMDGISEGVFSLDRNRGFSPPVMVQVDNGPDFIDTYFNNQSGYGSGSGKRVILKETGGGSGNGWYGDSPLTIVENHVFEKTNSKQKQSVGSGAHVRKVKGRVVLKNMDVRWTLYGGAHWPDRFMGEKDKDKDVELEFRVSKMGFEYEMYPEGEVSVSKVSVFVEDFWVDDVSNGAPWRRILGCYQTKDRPRESRSRALKFDLESVRPHPSIPLEEYRLQISILPMRLHLHQCQLEFLITFFTGKTSSPDHSQDPVEIDMPQEALLPYFQKFSITPLVVRVDYIPSRIDLPAIGHGKYVELVNLFQWKGVELQLKNVQAVGVYGWGSVCETIVGEWLEDISQNQVHKLLKGLPPIRSLVAIGTSAAKLVSLPVKNYKKDRRLVKGMQRGTVGFLRSVSLEAIGLGAHLAAGVHAILLQAEDIISTTPPTSIPRPIQTRVNPYGRSNSSQPKDARQGIQQAFETMSDGIGRSASALVQTPLKKYQRGAGVGSALATVVQAAPGAAIAPASAAARAVHSALLGVRNSLDPEHKKDSMDKYLGTTRS